MWLPRGFGLSDMILYLVYSSDCVQLSEVSLPKSDVGFRDGHGQRPHDFLAGAVVPRRHLVMRWFPLADDYDDDAAAAVRGLDPACFLFQ